jgi:hypothetical protein
LVGLSDDQMFVKHAIADPAIVRTLLHVGVGMFVDSDELWQVTIADVFGVLMAVDGPVIDMNAV